MYRYDLIVTGPYKRCTGVNTWLFSEDVFFVKDRITESFKTFIPVPLVTLCNIAIFIKLYQVRKQRLELGASNIGDSDGRKMNVMIISMTVLFVILLAPSSVYASIHGLSNFNDPISNVLYQVSLLNPSANFYVYFISGSLFRAEVLKLCQRSNKGQGHKVSNDKGQGHSKSDTPESSGSVVSDTSVEVSVISGKTSERSNQGQSHGSYHHKV